MRLVVPKSLAPQEQSVKSPSVFSHSLLVLGTTLVAFLGSQIIGPSLIAIVAIVFFRVNENKIVDQLDNNVYLRFLTILVVEVLSIWIIFKILHHRKKKRSEIGLSSKPTKQDVWKGIKTYGIYFLIYIAVLVVVTKLKIINTNQEQQLGFGKPHGMELIFTFFALVILPPIAEEIMFRGYLFFGLKEKMKPLYAGIITSLLFGAAHLEFGTGSPLNWAAAIDTFTLSCVLVYAANKYKSIWPGMVTHALKNFVAFVLLFLIK